MKKTFLLPLLIAVFTFSLSAQTVDELISQADNFALKEFNNQKALEVLLRAEKIDGKNWEVLWRISRSYVDIAEHLPDKTDKQKEDQLAMYQKSLDYANKAINIAPNKSVTYLRRAIANGRVALFKGVFSVISIVNSVRDDLLKSIKLGNGGNEIIATAHYVLARTHAKVCEKPYLVRLPLGLGWGEMDEAVKNYKKAIELRPNFRMFYIDYARTLITLENYKSGRENLNKIPSIPVLDEDDNKVLADSKQLLEQIKNK
ncbi:MAG: hypothetical protein HUU54_00030 [Ignavibacteriaceae bacterium]|nr:hypothetical protein [Ignavibacteriaceae bacterium]